MQQIRIPLLALAALGLATAHMGLPAASAQTGGAQQSAPQQQPGQQPSFSDDELKSFAVAALEVQRINQDYGPKVQATDSPDEQKKLQQEATQEMAAAVQDEGLSVDKYNEIVAAARQNPEIVSKIESFQQQAQ